MENFAETTCRFCLSVISDGKFNIIEETILHLLNLSVKEDINPVACTDCSMKLFETHQFKITCMDTEDNISSHVDSENVTPVDLRDVYLKINDNEYLGTIMEDERICRLCMHIVTSEFTSVEDVETDVIQICIPEINFSFTKHPVICAACLYSLSAHSSFLKGCLEVGDHIKSVNNCMQEPLSIKVEEVEVKSEENDDSNDRKRNLTGYMSESTLYNCDTSDDKIKCNDNLDNQFKQEDTLEMPMFKCRLCDFKSKYKSNIFRHQVKHDKSKVRLHECDTCDFKTKHVSSLRIHRLRHKSLSEVQLYGCDMCSYKTIHKYNVASHQLIHKDLSEVQMYTCDMCDYKTIKKCNLYAHMRRHKKWSEAQLYKCDKCDYEINKKHYLVQHQLKHKSSSEVQMYACSLCDFKSKYKNGLTNHQLTHADSSELPMYKCYTCSFETRVQVKFKAHIRRHKKVSEIQLYTCDTCGFETKAKNGLIRHQQLKCQPKHESSSEISGDA